LAVDVARFDHLAQRQGLTSRDAPAFYQTLGAMSRSNTIQLQRAADRHLRQHLPHWKSKLDEAREAGERKREVLARTVVKRGEEGKYSVAPFFSVPREQVG